MDAADGPAESACRSVDHPIRAAELIGALGRLDAADANALANNMGSVPGWTGTNNAARFEDFYISGNWESGDRDGNGFVNQSDADWLAARYAALGVAIPDRLAYSGTFEKWQSATGLSGRRLPPGGGG